MADLWTSNTDMTNKLIQEVISSKEQSEAVTRSVQQRNILLEKEVRALQDLLDSRIQLAAATDKMIEAQGSIGSLSPNSKRW